MRRVPLVLIALLVGVPSAGAGQELPTANRISGVDWYRVNFTKFKPGTVDEARQIIYDHFIRADQAAGRDPIPFDFLTGEWDHVVFFPLQEGPGELEWSVRPIDERWWQELAALEGGIEPARALVARFVELIERRERHIVQRRP